ncbi:hypothetical protein DSM43518_02039 [Mycobacterium marinum]|nr:hypothetical protein CCUG20998_03555 [Mycobacterium marinum]RFZ11199.1 hypothetical protein DSM43518_02039 [Mycobacterium marinum]RFZ15031.1 hypothetical protein VIMS_02461 [Mycobacterium marinum]RFZ25445.1 hypothetical protein DSM43519_01631 [Mycobacterium marinum]RFZ28332.1 hypothetical protein DSM44344_01377 [Mycobacterium marinum]
MLSRPKAVQVTCPRCSVGVTCTLRSSGTVLTVPDLAYRMAAHYREAHPILDAPMVDAGRRAGQKMAEALAGGAPSA